jgi:hypothetical protein
MTADSEFQRLAERGESGLSTCDGATSHRERTRVYHGKLGPLEIRKLGRHSRDYLGLREHRLPLPRPYPLTGSSAPVLTSSSEIL